MKSSLEIAQEAELLPIETIAERTGLTPDEFEPYGRHKAKVSLDVARAAEATRRRQDRLRSRRHADQGGRGQDHHGRLAHPGPRRDRQGPAALPARALARPGVRHQGRRRRRRARPGGADGGPEPPLHRRHPRRRRGQQPARRPDGRLDPARQPAQDRRAARRLEARARHERPRAAGHHDRPGRPRQRLPARVGLRHHRGLRGDGDPGRVARPARPAPPARRHHRRPLLRRRQARDGRGPRRGRRDDRAAEGRAQAEPDPDARGPALPDARGAVREHRARQLVARGGPDRAEARRLRDHRVRLRLGHGDGEVLRHRLPQGRDHAFGGRAGGHRASVEAPRRASRTTRAWSPPPR